MQPNIDQFDKSLHPVLARIVSEIAGCYGSQDYPTSPSERAEALNVKTVLKALGYEVSLSEAAAFWEEYSEQYQAGWMMGAETEQSVLEAIITFCRKRVKA